MLSARTMARAAHQTLGRRIPHCFDQPNGFARRLQKLRLQAALRVFARYGGIVNDCASQPQFPAAAGNCQCTNSDVEAGGAIGSKMTDGTTVDAARPGLDLPYDFHSAQLRCAGDRPTGEEGAKEPRQAPRRIELRRNG